MSRIFARSERRLAEHFYTRFPQRLDLKDVTAACHLVGEFFGISKWRHVDYDTIRRWAQEGRWEAVRQVKTDMDPDEVIPSFYQMDDEILRQRMSLARSLHHEALSPGNKASRRYQAARLSAIVTKALEEQNVRREFFSDREPAIIMEAIIEVAREISRREIDRDEVRKLFETRYRQLTTRSKLAVAGG